jgi:hypothetical protein
MTQALSDVALTDAEFAAAIATATEGVGKVELLLATRQGGSAVWLRPVNTEDPWHRVGGGDFGQQCLDEATRKRGVQVLLAKVSTALRDTEPGAAAAAAQATSKSALQTWLDASLVSCGLAEVKRGRGRAGAITAPTKEEVLYRAAWRCQMDGCADDLRTHLGSTASGNFSYLAHIVAASPDGPRGDPVLSARLANDADNILLLCDKCHRLIDRVDVETYTTEYLRSMRERNVAAVKQLLDTLAYPKTRAISLIGSITGQPHPPLTRVEMDEALWSQCLRADERSPQALAFMPRQVHNPHEAAFWKIVMRGLRQGIVELRGVLEGSSADEQAPERLALFPLTSTSVLVLAGRVIGDKANVTVFQPNRNAPRNRWLWPETATAPKANEFRQSAVGIGQRGGEACLRVSLTFDVTDDRVPASSMPTVDIRAARLGNDAVARPEDLVAFGQCVDEALKVLQDQWKVDVVHLFVGAPASACLKLGQKLQARHHATVVVYETAQGSKRFEETIRITRREARHEPTGESIDLNP